MTLKGLWNERSALLRIMSSFVMLLSTSHPSGRNSKLAMHSVGEAMEGGSSKCWWWACKWISSYREKFGNIQCGHIQSFPLTQKFCFSELVSNTLENLWKWYGKIYMCAVLEKTLESPLDCKQIKSVKSKENQPWTFIERTVAETQAPKLWLPTSKSQLTGKDPVAGKDWRQKEKRVDEDHMVNISHSRDMNFRGLWKTEETGVLQSLGLQRVRHET